MMQFLSVIKAQIEWSYFNCCQPDVSSPENCGMNSCILVIFCIVALLALPGQAFQPRAVAPTLRVQQQMQVRMNMNLKTASSTPGVSSFRLHAATAAAPVVNSAAQIKTAAVRAVSKLLATCGIGAYAAKENVLTQSALSTLSSLVFNLFQPCLLFVNVCQTIAAQRMAGGSPIAWILPMAAVAQIALGFVVGKILAKFLYFGQEDSSEAKQFLTCSTFGNSGPLPLVFTDALFRASKDPTLLSNSVAYISLYLLGWSPLFWVVGTTILSNPEGKKSADEERKIMMKRVFSPPVLASIVGLIVGSNAFMSSLFIPGGAIFHSIFEAMRTIGAGYLPSVLMILAGSLVAPPTKDETQSATGDLTQYQEFKQNFGIGTEKGTGRAFMKQVIVTYLCRFLLLPTVAFTGLKSLSIVAPAAYNYLMSQPLLLFVLLLETCMPPAQNSVTIMQLSGDKKGSSMMARTLLVIYALGTPALTFWMMRILGTTGISIA